jgi:hypothetical protein
MLPALQQKFNEIENQRKMLQALLEPLTDDQINQIPDTNKWSVAQIISHLILADENCVKYFDKKFTLSKHFKINKLQSYLRLLLMKILFNLPIKYKAPPLVSNVPDYIPKAKLFAQWLTVRINMQNMLNKVPQELQDAELFKQPFAGRMNLTDGMEFIKTHFKLHLKQIKLRIPK